MYRDWTREARRTLGLGTGKLPTHGLLAEPMLIDSRLKAALHPQGVERFKGNRPARRMAHRLIIVCACGRAIPAGRFGQHLRSRGCAL